MIDVIMMCLVGAIFLAMIVYTIIIEAYAAGWNASVKHHMARDRMDPFWTTYV